MAGFVLSDDRAIIPESVAGTEFPLQTPREEGSSAWRIEVGALNSVPLKTTWATGMSTSRIDDKGRIIVPSPIRKKLGIRSGSRLSWRLLGGKSASVSVVKGKEGREAVLEFLDCLENLTIERTGRPDFGQVSRQELWLKAESV